MTKKVEEVEVSTKKPTRVFEKTSHTVKKILKPNLQSCQSQSLKLVSASVDVVKTFSDMKDSEIFRKLYGILMVMFHEMDLISIQ